MGCSSGRCASRTTVILHNNFLKYPPDVAHQLAAHDACIWAMGKTSVGTTEVQCTELTHSYTMAAVRALRDASAGEDKEGEPFRFVYISGEGADQSGSKWLPLFSRVKTESASVVRKTASILAPSLLSLIEDLARFTVEEAKGLVMCKARLEALRPYQAGRCRPGPAGPAGRPMAAQGPAWLL
ncbi:predicted protein [Postia placenta Mad-698-R]|nr:predicted protein [Postia placenta Mad-698-R]